MLDYVVGFVTYEAAARYIYGEVCHLIREFALQHIPEPEMMVKVVCHGTDVDIIDNESASNWNIHDATTVVFDKMEGKDARTDQHVASISLKQRILPEEFKAFSDGDWHVTVKVADDTYVIFAIYEHESQEGMVIRAIPVNQKGVLKEIEELQTLPEIPKLLVANLLDMWKTFTEHWRSVHERTDYEEAKSDDNT